MSGSRSRGSCGPLLRAGRVPCGDDGRRVLRRGEPGGAEVHRPHRRRGRVRCGLLPVSRLGARRGLVRPRQRGDALRDLPRQRLRERDRAGDGVGRAARGGA